jgi:hypothetical protein
MNLAWRRVLTAAGIAAVALLVALRLYLTGDRDILALNAPYDEYWYVASALRGIWGGNYNHMAFAHLPVYSAWIAFLSAFGLPGRLMIDVAWLAASGYLAFALRNLTSSTCVAAVAFAFLAFHPYGMFIFDRALSETLLTVLSAFALAGFIEAWNCRGMRLSPRGITALVAVTLGFAAAFHIRKEGVLLLVPLAVLALVSVLRRKTWWSREGRWAHAFPLLVFPVAAALLMGLALAAANGVRWGIAVRHELAAPGYTSAIEALNAIDPGARTPRHVTVTSATRAAAYGASPTFAELRGFFEGPAGQGLARHTQQFTGVPGEIGNGWFYWALRDAGSRAGWHRSAGMADAKYAAIAAEINAAFAKGELLKRTVWLSFVDPDTGKWIRDVPAAAGRALHMIVAPSSAPLGGPAEDANARQFDDFVRALGRRRNQQRATLAGWLKVPPGSIVALGDAGRMFVQKELIGDFRPDVPGAFPFRISSEAGDVPSHVQIRLPDGVIYALPLNALKVGQMHRFPQAGEAILGVDQLSMAMATKRLTATRLGSLAKVWTWMGYALALLGVAGMALALAMPKIGSGPVAAIIALTLVAFLARATLLGFLDASSWSGVQARYLFPAVPLFTVFGVLGAWLIFRRRKQLEEHGKQHSN